MTLVVTALHAIADWLRVGRGVCVCVRALQQQMFTHTYIETETDVQTATLSCIARQSLAMYCVEFY